MFDLSYFLGSELLLTPADMSDLPTAPRGRPVKRTAKCEECGKPLVLYACESCDSTPKIHAPNPGARTLRATNQRKHAAYMARSTRPQRVS